MPDRDPNDPDRRAPPHPSRRDALRVLGVAALAACSSGEGTTDGAAQADGSSADAGSSGSPGIDPISSNDDHYITSCCGTPTVDGAAWKLVIADRGKPVATLTMATLDGLAATKREHTLQCIGAHPGNQAISNAVWTGLPLRDVLKSVGATVPAAITTLKCTAADGYSTGLPVADLDKPIRLVWRMNGAPIPPDHGYPARLIVPGRYGMKNPKWLTGIELLDKPYTGYWESFGWSDEAPYKPNTLVRSPDDGAEVTGPTVRVSGTAYAGSDPVVAVHAKVDNGDWQPAVLDYAPGPDVWALWHFDWAPAAKGEARLAFRCTTKSGATSKDVVVPDLNGWEGSHAVRYTVR